MNFTPKRFNEVEVFTVDFSLLLASGETISSAAWSITVVQGADANAATMIQGAASISGSKVSQKISGGVPGARYAPTCTVQTSNGQTLVLPDAGLGHLSVTA